MDVGGEKDAIRCYRNEKQRDLNQCSGYCNIPGRNITRYRNIKK